MSRFGDFTLLEEHGQSATAARFKATHASQGGPFFLKVHRRLAPQVRPEWNERCNCLIGRQHPAIAPHLGHGLVGDAAFSVSPWLDGLDLPTLTASLRERRVHLGYEHCLLILTDLALAVATVHSWAPTPPGPLLVHGALTMHHVRVGPEGQVWLTGLTTPRGPSPGRSADPRHDLTGVAAMLYDLVPFMRGGAARPPLPTVLDREIRRALAIGPPAEHTGPREFVDRLADVADALKVKPDRQAFADLVQRTTRALEKKAGEKRSLDRSRAPADAIPELVPVGLSAAAPGVLAPAARPLHLEPVLADPGGADGALLPELVPLAPRRVAAAPVADTAPLVPMAPQTPGPTAPPPWAPAAPAPAARVPASTAPVTAPPAPWAAVTSSLTARHVGATPPALVTPVAAAPMPATVAAPPALPPPSAVMVAPVLSPASAAGVAPASVAPPSPTPSPAAAAPSYVAPPSAVSTSAMLPRPRAPLLADADDPSGAVVRPTPAPRLAALAAPVAPSPRVEQPQAASPPPGLEPAAAPDAASLFERDRTDPDTVRPARLEAEKALPSVQALLRAGLVTLKQVEAAAIERVQRGGRTLEILVDQGVVDDDVVARALARAAARPLIDDATLTAPVDAATLRRVPRTYALARRLLPLQAGGDALVLAVADPFDLRVIDEVRALLQSDGVDVRVAPRAALTRATLAAFGAVDAAQGAGPRVLLCVQDDGKAQQIGARLASEGMQIEHVVEGDTAKQILSARPPHAVLCTSDLPRVDGRALLLFVREQEALVELPFFIVGPRGDDDLASRLLDLGADDFFAEPLRGEVVVTKLRRAAGRRAESTRAAPSALARVATDIHARPPRVPASVPSAGEFAFEDLPDLPPELSAGDGTDAVPAMPTGVMGTLRQMSLPEIVQSLEMGRKTASVHIVPQEGETGRIAFATGTIQFAECGALQGDSAFYALMQHNEGFFRIHYGDAPPSVNITVPTTFLLLEAMRLMDESGR
ncbi:MAG: DUF4388 domain-containing protein [Deltaproteobacteria bacterium]|nr:DUF4388 domain-containing protein [Deltaproteobacteria bacterium]